jgi:hypothetical protein
MGGLRIFVSRVLGMFRKQRWAKDPMVALRYE